VTKDKQDTETGWWTIVEYDDDKGDVYLDIRDINGVTVVCSANLGSGMGDPITEEMAQPRAAPTSSRSEARIFW
jgi:hypothetical protein